MLFISEPFHLPLFCYFVKDAFFNLDYELRTEAEGAHHSSVFLIERNH